MLSATRAAQDAFDAVQEKRKQSASMATADPAAVHWGKAHGNQLRQYTVSFYLTEAVDALVAAELLNLDVVPVSDPAVVEDTYDDAYLCKCQSATISAPNDVDDEFLKRVVRTINRRYFHGYSPEDTTPTGADAFFWPKTPAGLVSHLQLRHVLLGAQMFKFLFEDIKLPVVYASMEPAEVVELHRAAEKASGEAPAPLSAVKPPESGSPAWTTALKGLLSMAGSIVSYSEYVESYANKKGQFKAASNDYWLLYEAEDAHLGQVFIRRSTANANHTTYYLQKKAPPTEMEVRTTAHCYDRPCS